jgi:hypothetical protein
VDTTSVYWGNSVTSVMKVPVDGGIPTTLASAQHDAWGITVNSASVYWTAGTTVMKAPVGGGSVTTLASGQSSAFGIAVDGTCVSWTNSVTAAANAAGNVMKLTPK